MIFTHITAQSPGVCGLPLRLAPVSESSHIHESEHRSQDLSANFWKTERGEECSGVEHPQTQGPREAVADVATHVGWGTLRKFGYRNFSQMEWGTGVDSRGLFEDVI